MFSCLQILEAFLWFVLITLLNVTLIILTLSVSRLLKDRKSGSAGMPRPSSYAVFCLKKKNGVMQFVGPTTQQWWPGATLRLVPTFTAYEEADAAAALHPV